MRAEFRMVRKMTVVKVLMVLILLSFALVAGASDEKKGTSSAWEEVCLDRAVRFVWCGNDTVYLAGGGKLPRLVNIHSKETKVIPTKADFYDQVFASHQGRFLFLRNFGQTGSKTDRREFTVYEPRSGRLQTMPDMALCDESFGQVASPGLVSSDGKRLLWCDKREVSLLEDILLEGVPFPDLSGNREGFRMAKWSKDGRMLLGLFQGRPQRVVIRDFRTGSRSVIVLPFAGDSDGLFVQSLAASYDGKKAYIHTGIEGNHQNLYEIDIPAGSLKKVLARPRLIAKCVKSFDVDLEGSVVLSFREPDELATSEDLANPMGLFLLRKGAKKLERLTPGVSAYDYGPVFSDDGKAIAFARYNAGEGGAGLICVLIRK